MKNVIRFLFLKIVIFSYSQIVNSIKQPCTQLLHVVLYRTHLQPLSIFVKDPRPPVQRTLLPECSLDGGVVVGES